MPALKKYLSEVPEGMPAASVLHHEQVGHTDGAARALRAVLPDLKYTPKPTGLVRHLCAVAAVPPGCAVLDPFAGSGSTGAAMLEAERMGEGPRPFLLIEHGPVFDRMLVPRIARLTHAGQWDRGRPCSTDPLGVVHRVVRFDGQPVAGVGPSPRLP